MSSTYSSNELYEKALSTLNALQSNAQTLAQLRQNKAMTGANHTETLTFLKILNICPDDLTSLKCIHVTGTKGKGSTCAFVESILQRLGFRTGFYSSPHLMHVYERIRVDGKPISKEKFARYFFEVFSAINEIKRTDQCMPAYFKFLTIMAMKVFLDEKVDVAIVEVGIGGEHDSTNCIPRPVVAGMTTLDLDHTSILGATLPEIAWQKTGIMKPNSLFITVQQSDEVISVIQRRSAERNCPYLVAPSIHDYVWPDDDVLPRFGLAGEFQHVNVSLALQLARFWLLRTQLLGDAENFLKLSHVQCADLGALNVDSEAPSHCPSTSCDSSSLAFKVPAPLIDALVECFWPGRAQILKRGNVTFCLDAAHTPKSIMHCANWYRSFVETQKNSPLCVLIFHYTSDRDPNVMLDKLKNSAFAVALFCSTRLSRVVRPSSDAIDINYDKDSEVEKCARNEIIWKKIAKKSTTTYVFSYVEETLQFVDELARTNPTRQLCVLVTGSLHLVGGVLHFHQPNVFEAQPQLQRS